MFYTKYCIPMNEMRKIIRIYNIKKYSLYLIIMKLQYNLKLNVAKLLLNHFIVHQRESKECSFDT